MVKMTKPKLNMHHSALDRATLRGWGVPAPWIYGVGFQATFGDIDAQRHVSNVVYLRWIETFRVHYLRDYGWPNYAKAGATPMVIRQYKIDYLSPTHLGDDVIVTGQTKSVGTTSCVMEYGVWSAGLKAKASGVLVFLDHQNQPTRIPTDLKRGMIEIDKAVSSKR